MNSMRRKTCGEITEVIKVNPVLRDKLEFPKMEPLSLRTLFDPNFPLPEPHAPIEPHRVGINATHSPTQVASIPPNQHSPTLVASLRPTQCSLDVLSITIILTLVQGSLVSTMDFNPTHPTVLLAGTSTGEISVWDLTMRERIHHRHFEVGNALEAFQMALASGPDIAANRVRWDSSGIIFGVAFSQNIVHLYSYNGGRRELIKDLRLKLMTVELMILLFLDHADNCMLLPVETTRP